MRDLGIFGMIMAADIEVEGIDMGRVGVSTVSLVMETDDPSWGILIGVVVTRSDGDDTVGTGSVCDVTVAVLAGIGAIVIFFSPTFFKIVAAFPKSLNSFALSSFSMHWVMVPPLPNIVEGCISVINVSESVEGRLAFGSPSCNCCSFSLLMMHILL